MAPKRQQQVWTLVIWRLRHGDVMAVRAVDDSMSLATGEVCGSETLKRAATRICREQTGLEVVSWQPSERNTEAVVMTAVVTEALIEPPGDSVWIDVDQLPLMSAIASNLAVLEAYLALQETST